MLDKADIKELSIAAWRLEKWLENLNSDRKMAAKSALRGIKKYISASGVEIIDPIGSKFDPGLAVEVVNNEAEDTDEESLIIIETLSPYVYQNGELIQHAKVIIGTAVKEAKTNYEKQDDRLVGSDAQPMEIDNNDQEASPNSIEDKSLKPKENQPDTTDNTDDEVEITSDEIERMMKYAKIL